MKDTNTDRRILRTEKLLKKALLELLQKKPLKEITTSELCLQAEINRNTFYAHFKSPAELFECIEEDFFDNLLPDIESLFIADNRHKAITMLLEAIYKEKEICIVIEKYAGTKLLSSLVEYVRQPTFACWHKMGFTGSNDDMNVIFSFITSGCKDALLYWLTTDNSKTPAQMARFIELAALFGLSRFLKK